MFLNMPYAFWMIASWAVCAVFSGMCAAVSNRSVPTWGIITFLAGPIALFASRLTNPENWSDIGWYASPIVTVGIFIIAGISQLNAPTQAASEPAEPAHHQTEQHPPQN